MLLNNPDEFSPISIEKFDDISFHKDDSPEVLIQLKHHVKNRGDLTYASTDLWRTIKVWADSIMEVPEIIERTKFLIITTATAPKDSAAFHLRDFANRDVENA